MTAAEKRHSAAASNARAQQVAQQRASGQLCTPHVAPVMSVTYGGCQGDPIARIGLSTVSWVLPAVFRRPGEPRRAAPAAAAEHGSRPNRGKLVMRSVRASAECASPALCSCAPAKRDSDIHPSRSDICSDSAAFSNTQIHSMHFHIHNQCAYFTHAYTRLCCAAVTAHSQQRDKPKQQDTSMQR